MAKTEDGILEQDQRNIDRLKEFMRGHPHQEDVLRFAYAFLTYPHLEGLLLNVVIISGVNLYAHKHADAWVKAQNTSFSSLRELKKKFESLYGFANKLVKSSSDDFDRLGTAQYHKWAQKYKEKVITASTIKGSYLPENSLFRLGEGGKDFYGPETPSEEVYIQHQHICRLWTYYKSVTMQNVYDYISGKAVKKSVALKNVDQPTDVAIPQVDIEVVQKAAAEIPPLEFRQISGFGVDVETNAGQAMAELASYFLYNATRAAHTHDCIESAQEEIASANLDIIIRDDPVSWWDKKTTRVRLVEPEDMPMMRLVEKFSNLPELARMDNEAYGTDLNIADHAIKVCGGYHGLLTAYKEALESQKERLLTSGRNDLPTEIATASIPGLIDQRIHSLDITARHMVQQAVNFGSIAQVIGANRSRLGRIAGMPAAVQMPAMDAIRKFNLYQMRRMQLLGSKVDNAIKTQLGMNEDIRPSMIEDASPVATRTALSKMFETIGRDLQSFQEGLEKDSEKQKEIARKIKDQSIETALESDAVEFGVPS